MCGGLWWIVGVGHELHHGNKELGWVSEFVVFLPEELVVNPKIRLRNLNVQIFACSSSAPRGPGGVRASASKRKNKQLLVLLLESTTASSLDVRAPAVERRHCISNKDSEPQPLLLIIHSSSRIIIMARRLRYSVVVLALACFLQASIAFAPIQHRTRPIRWRMTSAAGEQQEQVPEGIAPPFAVTLEEESYNYGDAIQRTLGWVGAAIVFGGGLWAVTGSETGEEFFAGYLVEQSLSVDNLFVFLLLFEYFKVPLQYQDRVLNWGIYGAIVMRAFMIGVGAAALQQFHAILLVFAAILVYSSAKFFVGGDDEEDEDPSNNSIVKFSRNLIDSTDEYDGNRFFTMVDGVRKATPLFICMIAVEVSDVVFAVDSIPAVFGVTEVSVHSKLIRDREQESTFAATERCSSSSKATTTTPRWISHPLLSPEPSRRLLFQHVRHHGPPKPVHHPLQGGNRPQVLGARSRGRPRFHWLENDCRILWVRDSDGCGVECGGNLTGWWCGTECVGQTTSIG